MEVEMFVEIGEENEFSAVFFATQGIFIIRFDSIAVSIVRSAMR
jgi:hypothetical protein